MMTLRRFQALADSFGANVQRWPEAERDAAWALLRTSPAAQAVLAVAKRLDSAIAAASAQEQADAWPPGEADAALARLQSWVGGRIAASEHRRPPARRGWPLAGRQAWAWFSPAGVAGVAASGAIAITAGLLIGALSTTEPTPNTLLAVLQPEPIHLLEE
jgi:hypothetical protein